MSLGQVLANTLEKIYNLCNTRKLLQLRQEAKDVLDSLENLLQKAVELSPGEVVIAAEVALEPQTAAEEKKEEEEPSEELPRKVSVVSEIEECTEEVEEEEASPTELKSTPFEGQGLDKVVMTEGIANSVFPVFQSALSTKRTGLVEAVIDCLQVLIAHRLIQGVVTSVGTSLKSTAVGSPHVVKTEEAKETSHVSYQAQVIDMICSCEDLQEEVMELKVLKALLTAVTSSSFCVHSHGLLLAVRTSYNIYLMSRIPVNQTTAKATLTQMLNVVFQRMECNSQQVAVSAIVVTDYITTGQTPTSLVDTSTVQNFLNKVVADTLFAPSAEDVRQSVAGAFDRRESLEGSGMKNSSDSEEEHIEWREQQVLPAASSIQSADQQPLAPIVETMRSSKSTGGMKDVSGDLRGSVLQRDAYLVFRALCKLSASESTNVLDNTSIRGKVLALELIKILLENSGPVFRNSEKFISALKDYLCLSLLKNCSSSIQEALSLTCSIFLTLLSKFREALKAEIAVFFPMVVLKPIEPQVGGNSSTSGAPLATIPASNSYTHQLRVLRLLQPCCMDGQLIIDLFVNYDCDLENSNLFERLLMCLVRKAQGSSSVLDSEKAQQQEAIIREESLKCINKILNALIEWYSLHTASLHPQQTNSEDNETEGATVKSKQDLSSLTSSPKKGSTQTLGAGGDSEESNGGAGQETTGSRSSELLEIRDYKLRFQKGVDLFNKKPKKGVEHMLTEKLIGETSEDIANFLLKTENLDKTKIGHYLGDRDPSCVQVMHAYVDLMDFSDQELDVALRNFLLGFRLPGEAPQIDRLMEKFAERYLMCNPTAFKSADVAYVLSYSMIMLNTDAHNHSVKNKMTKEDFLKNNKGINDGSDLPEEYLSGIYDRILSDEIKMRDDSLLEGGPGMEITLNQNKAGMALLDMFLSLIPGRKLNVTNEPSEAAIKRTQDYLREKAKGATFFAASNADTVWPLFEVAWAPLLGAFSVLFERHDEQHVVGLCLEGFVASICITAQLGMSMLRNTFITSLSRFTMFYNPSHMKIKNALAFKALLSACERVGDYFAENWVDVLRCVSQWELVHQMHAGGPTDATLFAVRDDPPEPIGTAEKFRLKLRQLSRLTSEVAPTSPKPSGNSTTSTEPAPELTLIRMTSKKEDGSVAPPPQVLLAVDIQDINRLFIDSEILDSKAIVDFVTALCKVSNEELKLAQAPRVFSLTKIVEISHFNMDRIRLVWSRIWTILADFFIQVGCQSNLQLSMYAVDSLRQLSMKFLERDELANYTFQNDFLKPFVVVMRQSKAREIRELIIRCVSQMVLARVSNIKSGWKSMFMVFTTAAGDEDPQIVRLAFDTIEKIVREHFNFITETETTTFTDCVNCLIAFTNNPHSLDVALNSIAFIRYCAIKLAEGSIGDVEELPENLALPNTSPTRIVPAGSQSSSALISSRSLKLERRQSTAAPKGIRFIDKDEHVYFWFPLLAGLSELTFDPRQEIRTSALDVLFDTLKYHGNAFSESLWARILDSVLLPIFDHVRAEVTDTTTFTDDSLRAQIDAWLYETCVKCLQHLVDLFLQFHSTLHPLIGRLFQLLVGFMQRSHQSLASMGIAALVRFLNLAGKEMTKETWNDAVEVLVSTSLNTRPAVVDLVTPPERILRQAASSNPAAESTGVSPNWTLKHGVGSRRLTEVRCRAAVQLLTVQAIGEIYKTHYRALDAELVRKLVHALEIISEHSRKVDTDIQIRQFLAVLQAEDQISDDQRLMDPPLVRLEIDSTHSLLSLLLHLCLSDNEEIKESCEAEKKLMELCLIILERFDVDLLNNNNSTKDQVSAGSPTNGRVVALTSEGNPVVMASTSAEYNMYSSLIVATLKGLVVLPDDLFKRHVKLLFPLLTNLIACEYVPLEVQLALSEVFASRIGPLLS